MPEKINITDLEDSRCFQSIANEGNNLFDFVTISVWNAHKQMVQWLFQFYNDEDEYIDLFYATTHCHGWI